MGFKNEGKKKSDRRPPREKVEKAHKTPPEFSARFPPEIPLIVPGYVTNRRHLSPQTKVSDRFKKTKKPRSHQKLLQGFKI